MAKKPKEDLLQTSALKPSEKNFSEKEVKDGTEAFARGKGGRYVLVDGNRRVRLPDETPDNSEG